MGQGKLRCKQRRTVSITRRAAQQPARWRLCQAVAHAEHEPQRQQPGIAGRKRRAQQQTHSNHARARQHGAPVRHLLEYARQGQRHQHRASAKAGQGHGGRGLRQAKTGLHQYHGVDHHHRAARGNCQIQRQQTTQTRGCQVDTNAARSALVKAAFGRHFGARQNRRQHQHAGGDKTQCGCAKQRVVADQRQQQRGQHRAGQAFQVIRQA